jgi:tripartite-type tricarboxylate transporter receptor subunit TctC
MRIHLLGRALARLAAPVALAFPLAVAAQAFPTKAIRVVVPFPAGSSPDVTIRIIAPRLSEGLGQQIVVENRTGAAGIIGADLVAKSPADGYTLLYPVNSVICANPHLYSKLPYDPLKSFTPISMAANFGYVLMARNTLPVTDLKSLFAMARAEPGKLNYGSAGLGAGNHVVMELLTDMAKLSMVHVPSRDSAASVAGNESDIAMVPYTTAVPLARSGRTRALGVTLEKRLAALPDVPAIAELVPGFSGDAWHGLFAPAGTPQAVIDRLGAEMMKAVKHPDVQKRLSDLGLEPVGSSPAEFAETVRRDLDKWGEVIRKAKIKLD